MRDQSPPACGVSTLITSAPCCASIMAHEGPATPPVRSMTFTPANALSQSMLFVRFHPVDLGPRVAEPRRGDKPYPPGLTGWAGFAVVTLHEALSMPVFRRGPRWHMLLS